MPFFEFSIPLPTNYGSIFNYLYGYWLNAFLTAFIYIKLFSYISDTKIPISLYVLATILFPSILGRSLGGILVILILYSLVFYLFFNRHRHSYNTIIFYLLIVMSYFYYATSVVGSLCISAVTHFFGKYVLLLTNYGTNLILLIDFGIAYLILAKMKKLISKYTKAVVLPHPVSAWLINLYLLSFLVIRQVYHTQFLKLSGLQYGLLGIAYGVLTYLILRHVTRYYHYQQYSTNLESEMNNLQVYTSHVEEMYDALRLFRHDYKNLLLSLDDAIKQRNIDQVASIFHRVILPTGTQIDLQSNVLSKLSNINSLEVKSLLFDKIVSAQEKGITVKLEIEEEVTPLSKVDLTDMLRIISILFDNAIDAAAKANQGKINFALFNDHHDQILIIGNSTKKEKINLQQLTRRSSRVLTFAAHGLGLRNLRQLLSRYSFIENRVSSHDYYFEQTIVIHQS